MTNKKFTSGFSPLIKKILVMLTVVFALSLCCAAYTLVNANDGQIVTSIELTVDYGSYDKDELPIGAKGQSYCVFGAYAVDNNGNKVTDIDVFVYDPDGKLIVVTNGRFETAKVGVYSIVYLAKYLSFNDSETVKINVEETCPELYYVSDSRLKESGKTGEIFNVYNGSYYGGEGELSFNVEVTFARGDDVEEVKIEKSNDGYYFIPEVSGNYKIVYTVIDFIGQKVIEEKVVTITDSLYPIFNIPSIGKSARVGDTLSLPIADAVLYNGSEKYYLPVKVYYDDTDVSSQMSVKLETAGVHTIKYVAQNVFNAEYNKEQSFEIIVNDPNKEGAVGYIDSFMYLENLTASCSDAIDDPYAGIYVLTNDGSSEQSYFQFMRALHHEYITFSLASDDGKNFNEFTVYLTDSKFGKDIVTIKCVKFINEDEEEFVNVYVAGALKASIKTRFENFVKDKLEMSYSQSKKSILDDSGATLINIDYFDDGRAFTGFKSGSAFFAFSIGGVSGNVRIKLSSIAKSNVTNAATDLGAPMFITDPKFSDVISADVGEEVTLLSLNAFDLLDENVRIKLTILDPAGIELFSDYITEDYTFTVSKNGIYNVEYAAYDSKGRKRTKNASIYVADRIPPQITVEGLPYEVEVGEEIELPQMVVTDNVSDECLMYVYVVYNNYNKKMISETYKFETVGEYVIRYVAYDGDLNCTIVEFKVVCK